MPEKNTILQNIWRIPLDEIETCECCNKTRATQLYEFDRYDMAVCDNCSEFMTELLKIQAWMRMKYEN